MAGLVGMRCNVVGLGSFRAADLPRMVDAAATRVDAVAGSNRFLAGDHRCTHSRRPHRLTPSPQRLWMAVARPRVGPCLSVAGAELRCLRAGSGAWNAGCPSDHLPRPRAWRTGGAYSRTFAHAAVPYRAAAIASVASSGLDLDNGGCGAPI